MALPRILDPSAITVVGSDAHLPALLPDQLLPESLARALARAHLLLPEIAGDGRLQLPGEPAMNRPAAVLIPLILREQGLQMLLTQRSDHLRDHAGQISFPGGRSEPHDDGPAGTALREAEEEVGLPPAAVQVIGRLPTYTTVTGFEVVPVVGLVRPPLVLRLDAFEVASAFEVPLQFLMTPAHHRRHVFEYQGGQRQFLSMPWQSSADATQAAREYFIWGATAAMIRNLYNVLRQQP